MGKSKVDCDFDGKFEAFAIGIQHSGTRDRAP